MGRRIWVYDKSTSEMVEVTSIPKTKGIAKWPFASEAMAVDPESIPEARSALARHGVQTEYDGLGRPIMRDRAHRKAHMAALGFYDRSCGYSDQAPVYFSSSDKYERTDII